jgi:parvulin-like peptidyl-prolyl isomerase
MLRIKIGAMVLVASLGAAAQVAMHSPTLAKQSSAFEKSAPVSVTDKSVVKVNGVVLTDRDLLREMMIIFPYAQQHGGRFPKEMEPGIRKGALDMIIFEELVYQDAERRGVSVPASKLERAMTEFKKQFNSEGEFQAYLKAEHGGSLQDLSKKVRRAIIIQDQLDAQVNNRAKLTSAQVRAFYNNNDKTFTSQETVSIQTISIVIPDKATSKQEAEARQKAEDALKQAKAAKNYEEFGVLAEKVSQDDWRVMMGDHKALPRGKMPAEVEKIAFSMKAGEVSGLIHTENSWCIIRVNAHNLPRKIPYAQLQGQLKKDLEAQKTEQLRKALSARLKKTAKIEVM